MKNNIRTLFIALYSCIGLACENLDVVGTHSLSSFDQVLNQIPAEPDLRNAGWSLSAPDNSARFIWSANFAESPRYDVMLELDGDPFIRAGLDPEKLPENYFFAQGKLMVGRKLGNEQLRYQGQATPLASYQQILKHKRRVIGYHGALDHYGINLGEGNLFEWAKDMKTNDKDMVFVLNPHPLIAAGLDPHQIEGWVFTKVLVDDEKGKPLEADTLLKPFNLQ